jgi:FkbM family methyltransferase
MKNKEYYSQHGEEEIINKYLDKNPDIEKGIYIDFGASFPTKINNTYYYYKRGWNGILIEPHPSYKKINKKVRPKDIYLSIAITDYDGKVQMGEYIPGYYGSCTVESPLGHKHKKQKQFEKLYFVKCMTINTLIKKYPKFAEPDFISMDIETNEEKALSKCDFTIFKPKIICIELPHPSLINKINWGRYLTSFYDFKEILDNNAFYVRKKK